MKSDNFSAIHSRLDGALLIEASAGTGKTYSLMHILLRLIIEKNIPIEKILLVTFTKAATQEMKFRLRSLLIETVQILEEERPIRDKTLEDQLEEWIHNKEPHKRIDRETVIVRMKKALEGLEDISVETIHAFCQKMMNNYSFSSGKIAEFEVGGDSEIIRKVLDEQMRKETRLHPDNGLLFMSLPEDFLEVALKGVLGMPKDPSYGEFNVYLRTTKDPEGKMELSSYLNRDIEDIEGTVKDLLEKAAKEVRLLKEEQRLMTFDDMLVRMYEQLKFNPSFAKVVRSQFDAVLIDEFQDTDPVQYRVFSTLFLDPDFKGFVGFVGDPKQSIYRFRSADLSTYLEAKKTIGRTESLEKNYRSYSGIVNAINEFFSVSTNPFGQKDLPFYPSQVGKKRLPLLKKVEGGYEAVPAFEMWWNTPNGKTYGSVDGARKDIDKMVASDIDRLLNEEIYIYDDSQEDLRRVRPSDIAILVEQRKDAEGVEEALRNKGIRTLRSSRENVLDTEERNEILSVLKALEEPENSKCLTAARATRIFNESLKAILANEDMAQEDRQLMDYLKSNYSKFGLSKTFKELFNKKHTVENLLPLKNGERTLANYEQLIEILHTQSKKLQSLPGLIRWFDKENSGDAGDNDERSVRRESDSDVVQVETIHKSKGLEYPIVYIPGANRVRKSQSRDFQKFFLNQEGRNDLFFYGNTPEKNDPIKKKILDEQDKEKNRVAYVAMTRASSRLVIPFLQKYKNNNGADFWSFSNAYGRILGGKADDIKEYRDRLKDRFNLMQKDIEAEVRETFKEKIGIEETLSFSENVAVIKESAPIKPPFQKKKKKTPVLEAEKANNRSPQWLQSSFSSIVRGLHSEIEYKGMDEGEEEPKPEGSPDPDTLSFDGGAAFGDFLHRIIEKTPFDLGKEENAEELTEHVSKFFKTDGRIKENGEPDSEEVKAIVRMFQEITRVEIFPGIHLIDVGKKEKSPELEFLLGGISEGKRLLVEQLVKALHELMPNQFKDFHPEDRMISGYLTGSMDMVFFAEDKYWLIDWKSNFARKENGDLVTDANGYTPERINALMDKNFYHLQYLLYLVGLRRFLNHRLNVEESYDLIGGIGYVFLRGVRANRKDQAIYRYRPPLTLIKALDDLLKNGYDENKIKEWKHKLEKGEG